MVEMTNHCSVLYMSGDGLLFKNVDLMGIHSVPAVEGFM